MKEQTWHPRGTAIVGGSTVSHQAWKRKDGECSYIPVDRMFLAINSCAYKYKIKLIFSIENIYNSIMDQAVQLNLYK